MPPSATPTRCFSSEIPLPAPIKCSSDASASWTRQNRPKRVQKASAGLPTRTSVCTSRPSASLERSRGASASRARTNIVSPSARPRERPESRTARDAKPRPPPVIGFGAGRTGLSGPAVASSFAEQCRARTAHSMYSLPAAAEDESKPALGSAFPSLIITSPLSSSAATSAAAVSATLAATAALASLMAACCMRFQSPARKCASTRLRCTATLVACAETGAPGTAHAAAAAAHAASRAGATCALSPPTRNTKAAWHSASASRAV